VLELQGDSAQWGGPRDLLQDTETQAEARVTKEIGMAMQMTATMELAMSVLLGSLGSAKSKISWNSDTVSGGLS